MTDTVTPKPASERAILGRFTENYAKEGKFFNALGESVKQGGSDIKNGINVFDEASKGKRGVAFGRVAGIGAGAFIAADALRSRDDQGNERSGLVRIGQAILGTGVAVGSLAVGRGR